MNQATRLARVIVRQIIEAGITDAVISPGSRNAPLSLALVTAQDLGLIKLHIRIDERTAGFYALGLAKATNRPVPVICTSGTAVANYHPAVLEASHSNIPLFVITADRPAELRRTGANQTTEQARIFGKAVRYFADISGAAYPMELPLNALATGPVHLNVQFEEPLIGNADTSWLDNVKVSPPRKFDRRKAGTLASKSTRGLLVIGHDRGGLAVDDVAKFAIEYIETIKITEIAKVIKNAYGDRWFSKFVNEYKIQSFDIFCTQVYNKFLESVVNEFTGRISDINDINYGKPIAFKPSLSLTKAEVRTKVEKLLIVSISKYLMLPDVKSGFSKKDTLESIDTPEKILQTKTSDLQIDTKSPEVSIAVIKTATQSQKDLIFEKEVTREVQDTNIPNISKARLRREILNNGRYGSDDGVYGNVSSDSGNMRIMNDGFRNNRLRDIDSMEVIQNQQYLL